MMTRLLIDNSGRSGVVGKMTSVNLRQLFTTMVQKSTEKDPARSRVHVRDNKTVGVHGPAVLWISDDLHQLIDMYIRIARNQFLK